MMKKKQLKFVKFILCVTISAFMMQTEALAMDSPTGGFIEVFPVPGNPDTAITNNYGTINYAKTNGSISYNYNLIIHLEGATVGENKSTGTIDQFAAGRVENNYGTINRINNTASVGTNTPGGVIKENSNSVDKNMGTIENQYNGTIKENYGNVGNIGASANIEKLYEGTITENNGSVVICPAPEGILTVVKIVTNKNLVRIEADTGEKSSVVVEKNELGAVLHVCAGADCTVIDNAGTIEIEKGGICKIAGKNTGAVSGEAPVIPGDNYNYELILDNVNLSDITFVDFFKKTEGKIYVMDEGQDRNIIVSYDTDKYYYPDATVINDFIAISIDDSEYSVLDNYNKTFTVHFHNTGEFVSSPGEEHTHMRKCGGKWNGSICTATFNKEACSYGEWIIDREAKAGVEGKKHRVCSLCNGVENATIPAIPNNGKEKTDSLMKETFVKLEKGRDTFKSEPPVKVEIDRDTFKSDAPAHTVIASEAATNDFGNFDLKVHRPDEKTTANQEFLAKTLVGPNVRILMTQNIYPRRDLSTTENGSLKKLTRNNLPKEQAGPVFAVIYNETDGAYVLNGTLDAKGTAVFNGFKLRNASTITICK